MQASRSGFSGVPRLSLQPSALHNQVNMALGAKDASSSGGSSNTHEVEIKKSKLDKREYKYLTLPNKLRVILISNPMADKGSASLDVKVGVSLDPKPLYGTAHFLEHMLFMGTKKYPKENEYSAFMQNNGGMKNAFTSLTNTNYFFDVSNDAF